MTKITPPHDFRPEKQKSPEATAARLLLQQFFGNAFGHRLVGFCARVQMVAGIETAAERLRIVVTAHRLVKIDAAVKVGSGAEPFVERHTDDVAILVVGAPAVNRQ